MCLVSEGYNTHLTVTLAGQNNIELSSPCPVIRDLELTVYQKQWREDEVITPGAVSEVYSMKFKKPIKRIIFVDGAPMDWAAMGITQNKREDDKTAPGFLDWSGYTLAETPGEGSVNAKIIFEYYS